MLIGDVVGSRRSADRAELHRRVSDAVREINEQRGPLRPLRITVGDEYQGCFGTVGDALSSALALRIALAPDVDVRHGIGWGTTTVLDHEGVEDGPGWWAARDAIVAVEEAASLAGSRSRRTAYARAPDVEGAEPAAVNAALVLCDERVSGLSQRSLSVLRGLLGDVPQQEIATALGISASAVSQRVRADGLAAVVRAHDLLAEVR